MKAAIPTRAETNRLTQSKKEISKAVETLFGALNDETVEKFEAFCLENNLMWRCVMCRSNNQVDHDHCDNCGHERKGSK